ncbi:unnamed protein product [Clavelina lepadiformis]|uniref:G-protein coupled receptors family 1 profile domain-containing protein n=1 Tax=Clavelina lepadiformis TaxID=159417 RepID=A0ABP0FAC0_CLALP
MLNATVPPPEPYNEQYWIISEVFILCTGLLDLYYLVCLMPYACSLKQKGEHKRLVLLSVLSTVIIMARLITDQIVAFLGWRADIYCVGSVSASFVLYAASIGPVYLFLWLRQNAFFSKPQLQHLACNTLKYTSWATLFIVVASATVVCIIYPIPSVTGWSYQATAQGCRDVNDTEDLEAMPLIINGIAFAGQISLLLLLVYPLISSKKRQKRFASPNNTEQESGPHSSTAPAKQEPSLRRKAILGSYHKCQPSDTQVVQQDIELSALPVHDRSSGIYNVEHSDDDLDVFSENGTDEDGNLTDDFASQSDLESEVDRASPGIPRRLSLWKKSIVYIRKAGVSKNHYKKSPKKRDTGGRNRSESAGSAKSMIFRKREARTGPHRPRSKSEIRRERQLNKVIWKVFILATICVVSDMIATAIQLILVVPELAYLALYDVNLLVNVTCIIMSFKNWDKILTYPWKRYFRITKPRSSSNISQTSTISGRVTTTTIVRSDVKCIGRNRVQSDASSLRSMTSQKTGSSTLSRPNTPDRSSTLPRTLRHSNNVKESFV